MNAIIGAARLSASKTGSSNFIGFLVSASFDVHEFIVTEDPEKNWGDLLGALGVTFVKVWIAGYLGLLAVGAVLTFSISSPIWGVLMLGLGVSVLFGYGLDKIDEVIGFKESIKRVSHQFAFNIKSIHEWSYLAVVSSLSDWENDFKESIKKNDPLGHCALYCGSSKDRLYSWMYAFGWRGEY